MRSRLVRRLLPLLAVPVSLMMVDTALAAPKVLLKSTGAISRHVPGNGVAVKAIDVGAKGTIVDVDVILAVDHFANLYVDLYLRHPSGRVVMLSANNGGFGDGYGELSQTGCDGTMRFSDEAPTNVDDQEEDGVITGVHQPQDKRAGAAKSGLGALDGLKVQGRWELMISSNAENSPGGTLECAKLRITYSPA